MALQQAQGKRWRSCWGKKGGVQLIAGQRVGNELECPTTSRTLRRRLINRTIEENDPIGDRMPSASSPMHEVRPPARELVRRAGRRAGRDSTFWRECKR
ncbi:MAG: hypothetical protein NTX44_07605 [Ignavibacteriales bacterium]|nr:hypothetical protein [Ignavibacteriales bacterium]